MGVDASVLQSSSFDTTSRLRGQKLVPFIPILKTDFKVWFKKVCRAIMLQHICTDLLSTVGFSLASGRHRGRFRSGSQRACLPAFCRAPLLHSKIKDEPVKNMLRNVNSSRRQAYSAFTTRCQQGSYHHLGPKPEALPELTSFGKVQSGGEIPWAIASQSLSLVANPSWKSALLL